DKSVSLLDTACARVAISQNAVPPAIEDCRRQIDHLEVELGILDREGATGGQHDERMAGVRQALEDTRARLAGLEARWEDGRKRVEEIRSLAQTVEARYLEEKTAGSGNGQPFRPSAELAGLQDDLTARLEALRAIQGQSPLMQVSV